MMKNHKQLLADFYLDLLAIKDAGFKRHHHMLYDHVLIALSDELESDMVIVQTIFERMASEDSK